MISRPMGSPTAHQIQYFRVLRYLSFEEITDCSYRPLVYMYHQTGGLIKDSVVVLVLTLEIIGCESRLRGNTSWQPEFMILDCFGEL